MTTAPGTNQLADRRDLDRTALGSSPWVEFNRVHSGLVPIAFERTSTDANLSAILYVDARNRVAMPRLNRYLPLIYSVVGKLTPASADRTWLRLAGALAEEMRDRGVHGSVSFSPEIRDVRPWRWAGFRTDVSYTAYIDFPFRIELVDRAVRKKIAQARDAGYTVEHVSDASILLPSIRDTEKRQVFRYGVDLRDVVAALEMAGPDVCRAYVCRAANGDVASARLAVHWPGTRAFDWLAGTSTAHLKSGATQLIIDAVLRDLGAAGALGIDLGGANVATVASAKMSWGARLECSYVIEEFSMRNMARLIRSRWREARRRRVLKSTRL